MKILTLTLAVRSLDSVALAGAAPINSRHLWLRHKI